MPSRSSMRSALDPGVAACTSCRTRDSILTAMISLQTLEMLTKRAGLLEKKVSEQMDKAKAMTKAGNKRGRP